MSINVQHWMDKDKSEHVKKVIEPFIYDDVLFPAR